MILSPDPVKIDLRFEDCSMGWIKFSVLANDEKFDVFASHIFNPFNDMIKWLESLAIGHEKCSFKVDEEGSFIVFSIERIDRELDRFILCLDIDSEHCNILINETVNRSQFVTDFYNRIRLFSKSSIYIAKRNEWEFQSVLDAIYKITDYRFTKSEIVEFLVNLDCDNIERLFSYIYLFYESEQYDIKLSYILNEIFDHVVGTNRRDFGIIFNIENNFESHQDKLKFIESFLDEHYNSWIGENLQDLKSNIIIEKYGDLVMTN